MIELGSVEIVSCHFASPRTKTSNWRAFPTLRAIRKCRRAKAAVISVNRDGRSSDGA
jgi:hypothetical protein